MVGLNRDEILIRKINVVVGCDPHSLGVSESHYSTLPRVCVCVCGACNIDQAEKRMTLSLCILMTVGDQRILLKYFSVYHWSCNYPDYQCFCASALVFIFVSPYQKQTWWIKKSPTSVQAQQNITIFSFLIMYVGSTCLAIVFIYCI